MIPLHDVVFRLVAGGRELGELDDQLSARLREIEEQLRERSITTVRAVRLPDGAELAWSGAVRGRRNCGVGPHRWRLVIRDVDGSVADLLSSSRDERCEAAACGALGRLVGLLTEAV